MRRDIEALQSARDDVEALLESVSFHGAPFDQIGLVIRFDDHTDLDVKYQRFRRDVTCELPVAVHVELAKLRTAGWAKDGGEDLRRIFRFVMLDVLAQVSRKYSLQWPLLREEQKRNEFLVAGTRIAEYLGVNADVASKRHAPPPADETSFKAARVDALETLVTSGVIIELPSDARGAPVDLERRRRVEDSVAEYLQSTRNGVVTGTDYGSGSMGVFCDVYDAEKAAAGIRDVLARAGCLHGAKITRTIDDQEVVVYPPTNGPAS